METVDRLAALRLVPVVSLPGVEAGLRLAELLQDSGLGVIEITYRTSWAAQAMRRICREFPELLVIAGTVLAPEQVDEAVEAGVRGIVSPGFSHRLAAHCRARGVDFFPGVCTPSEVQAAREEGLFVLKFFPASLSGGTEKIALFDALYPDVRFMPTGGVGPDNLKDYLSCANVLCCGGTWLCPQQLLAAGAWKEIETRLGAAVELLAGLEQ